MNRENIGRKDTTTRWVRQAGIWDRLWLSQSQKIGPLIYTNLHECSSNSCRLMDKFDTDSENEKAMAGGGATAFGTAMLWTPTDVVAPGVCRYFSCIHPVLLLYSARGHFLPVPFGKEQGGSSAGSRCLFRRLRAPFGQWE
jgi:hypothetical protein